VTGGGGGARGEVWDGRKAPNRGKRKTGGPTKRGKERVSGIRGRTEKRRGDRRGKWPSKRKRKKGSNDLGGEKGKERSIRTGLRSTTWWYLTKKAVRGS